MTRTVALGGSDPNKTGRHYNELDGVRAIAAYAVIATHAGFNSGRSLDSGPFAPLLARLDFGVTLFFLLSGFLLFRPFAAAAISGAPPPRVASFWWRRFLRVAPAYWIAVSVTLAVLSTRRVTAADWWSYLTLTQTYNGHNLDPALTQMWTLAVEITFYAALPLLCVSTRRLFPRSETAGHLYLICSLGIIALGWDLFAHARYGVETASLLWLPAYLDWFGLGMLLAVASLPTTAQSSWRRILGQWAQSSGTCWVGGALLFWLATLPIAGPRNLLPTTGWEWTIKHALYGAAAFFFLLPLVLGHNPIQQRLLGNRFAQWLGEVSYGVYLWHLGLLLAIQRWLGWVTFSGHFPALFAMTALAATATAAISWHLIERPLLRRFGRPWRRGVPEAGDQQPNGEQTTELNSEASSEWVG